MMRARSRKGMLVFLLLSLGSQPAAAKWVTGNSLHEGCGNDAKSVQEYVMGAMDGHEFAAGYFDTELYCLPKGVTPVQAADIVCKYLDGNPEHRDLSAGALVAVALKDVWPCS